MISFPRRTLGSGFTLLEVLMVLLILSLLSYAVYPLYQQYLWKARATAFLSLWEPYKYALREAAKTLDTMGGFSGKASSVTFAWHIGTTDSSCQITSSITPASPSPSSYFIVGYGIDTTHPDVQTNSSSYGSPSLIAGLQDLLQSLNCTPFPLLNLPNQDHPYVDFTVTRRITQGVASSSSYFYFDGGLRTNSLGFGPSLQDWQTYFSTPGSPAPSMYDFFQQNLQSTPQAQDSLILLFHSPPLSTSGCYSWNHMSNCPGF